MSSSVAVRIQRPQVKRPPLFIMIPAMLVGICMLVPLVYLFVRAGQADMSQLADLVLRPRNLDLLINTLALTFGVLLVATFLAFPLAWLVTRTDMPYRRLLTILAVVPLAVPGYVMAYALLGIGGHYGALARLFDIHIPNIQGYWGAVWALALYTFPYIFLNLRAALLGLDSSLEESAQSLGYSHFEVLRKIILPHLAPAILAGYLVVGLYVLGDFGAVALMRYEAFSYAIYNQYSGAFDRIYAAWLSIMLLSLAACFVFMEVLVLRRKRLASVGSGSIRPIKPKALGRMKPLAVIYLLFVFGSSIGLPIAMLSYWLFLAPPDMSVFLQVPWTFARSVFAAMPAAVLAALCALPVCYMSVRYPSRLSAAVERSVYIGYALPPLTLALAMVFFALHAAYFFYQTLGLLIISLTVATLALAMGPIRSALMQTRPNLEEASYALGYSQSETFYHVVFPRMRRGILSGVALAFMFCMKELPITLLLAPTGYNTLAVTVFSRTVEGMMAEAAPFAAAIVIFSGLSVGMVLNREANR
ncbi:ABC transporter permease [Nitrincola alkalilacustris]|uniref:ABC transporter permease n=1 Tax=Nitrincola alkalilacustris TaxID=1571224 RepID=UPI0019816157|nr:iron ABC transporter permease [Nitrincola alkalilacustris]